MAIPDLRLTYSIPTNISCVLFIPRVVFNLSMAPGHREPQIPNGPRPRLSLGRPNFCNGRTKPRHPRNSKVQENRLASSTQKSIWKKGRNLQDPNGFRVWSMQNSSRRDEGGSIGSSLRGPAGLGPGRGSYGDAALPFTALHNNRDCVPCVLHYPVMHSHALVCAVIARLSSVGQSRSLLPAEHIGRSLFFFVRSFDSDPL